MTEWHGAPSPDELRGDLMARLRATENREQDLRQRNFRLTQELDMTREQLDRTRERLHEALMRNGDMR